MMMMTRPFSFLSSIKTEFALQKFEITDMKVLQSGGTRQAPICSITRNPAVARVGQPYTGVQRAANMNAY